MKLKRRFALLVLSACILAVSWEVSAQKHYKELEYPKLNKINVPEIERVELDNGMILYLAEDHELPLINASARIGVGSIYEPAEKTGLADITGTVMRTGGTKNMTGDQMDEFLESIAASVETGIGTTSGSASMSVLKEDIDKGLEILADVLMNPAFPEEKIELEKVQQRSGIARRNDDANGIAFREFSKLIYGPESVYARNTEYETIDAITRQDLVDFHKSYFHPNNIMLSVWGDFKTKEMVKKVKAAFKSWKKNPEFERPRTPEVDYDFNFSVNYIRKEDVNQSTVLLGHIGGMLNNPDYFSLRVMNEVLSGGFASRLFSRVRSDQGLAYAVFGQYGANYDYPGQFYAGLMTKSETTVQAIQSLLNEIELLKTEEITDRELALAKESYFNSFVFNFDTKSEVVNRLMTYDYYGYPKNFLQQTKDNIEKVTKADVLRVAKKYLRPDHVRILVVGNDTDFDQPLSVLGKVNEIDITIPVAEEDVAEATPESLAKGRKLFEQSREASGGAKGFKGLDNVQFSGTMSQMTPQGEMAMEGTLTLAFPDRSRLQVTTPMGEITRIINGNRGWVLLPQGTQPLPPAMQAEAIFDFWHDIAFLYTQDAGDNLQIQALGIEQFDGKKTDVLLVQPKGQKNIKLYLDAETHLPVKMHYQALSQQGPVTADEMIVEFIEADGLKFPSKIVTNHNGQKAAEINVSVVKTNVPVDDSLFNIADDSAN